MWSRRCARRGPAAGSHTTRIGVEVAARIPETERVIWRGRDREAVARERARREARGVRPACLPVGNGPAARVRDAAGFRVVGWLGVPGDPGAGAGPGVEEALGAQLVVGLDHGPAGDAQVGGKRAGGRNMVPDSRRPSRIRVAERGL